MRTWKLWAVEQPRGFVDQILMCDRDIVAHLRQEHGETEYAQFIVDACNAAESEGADDVLPDWASAMLPPPIREGEGSTLHIPKIASLSPRGQAVMDELTAYEAVMPRLHSSPSSPIDEVGDS